MLKNVEDSKVNENADNQDLSDIKDVNLEELDDNDNSYTSDINLSEFTKCEDTFTLLLKDIAKYPLLTKDEEFYLATKYKETKGDEYKQKLVNHNLRLVVNIAKHYKTNNISILDLFQEGTLGLMTAVERFDPDLGYRFSTYSTWWIKQAIMRYIANNGRLIRIPVHANECLFKYNKFVSKWSVDNPNSPLPSVSEIAKALGVSEGVLKTCINNTDIISLSTTVGEDQDSTLEDFIPNDTNIDDIIENSILRQCINELLDDLTEKERNIIKLRFGFIDGNVHTLEEIGEMYGVTRERIRQIESKAIRKLRSPKRQRILKDFTDTMRV